MNVDPINIVIQSDSQTQPVDTPKKYNETLIMDICILIFSTIFNILLAAKIASDSQHMNVLEMTVIPLVWSLSIISSFGWYMWAKRTNRLLDEFLSRVIYTILFIGEVKISIEWIQL